MNLIEENPFRILGVISNASAKEIKEAETYIIRYLDVGKSAELKFDISPPLKKINRTSNLVSNAKSQIHSNFDKLSFAVFWFVNGSSIDKIALKKLSENKDINHAYETFKKGSKDFNVSKSTFSSILNFTTIELLNFINHKNEKRFIDSIKFKYEIINNKSVLKLFENIITGDSGKINHQLLKDKFIKNVKELLREVFPSKNYNQLLSEIFSEDDSILKKIEEDILNSLIKVLNKNIEAFKSFFSDTSKKSNAQIIKSKTTILNRAKSLIRDTKSDLNKLKKLVGKDSFQFTNIVNEIYTLVNGSAIMCYNKEIDNEKIEISPYIKLLEEASKEISNINCSIKETIVNNLSVIKNDESSSNCQFCHSGEKGNYNIRVKMHKFDSYNPLDFRSLNSGRKYTYFKDGGIAIACCLSCAAKKTLLKVVAFIAGCIWVLIYPLALLDLFFTGFSGGKWWFKLMRKLIFYNNVSKHPTINGLLRKGYLFDMP